VKTFWGKIGEWVPPLPCILLFPPMSDLNQPQKPH